MISLYMSYTLRRCWRTALIHSTTVNKLSAPWMAAFWDGCSLDGCSLDGCFLGWLLLGWLLLSIFADFEQVKKTNSKTPVEETGCLCILFLGHCLMSTALYPGFSDL